MKLSNGSLNVARALRTALAVAVLGVPLAVQAATQTYNVDLAQLIAMPNNCGTGSYYNNCGSAPSPGWGWTDTLTGATISAVSIQVNMGVDCSGATRTTLFNTTAGPTITPTYWCDCTARTQVFTLTLPAAGYLPGALNQFVMTNAGTCLGSCTTATLSNHYAIVTVTYTGGTGGTPCDLSPIEAKLDDRTRFTDDTERNTATTTITNNILNGLNPNITRLETKLDDGTRFTSDAERTTQTNTLVTEINANETKIDRLEAKLDDARRFTSDAELAVVQQSIDALEAKADASGTNIGTLLDNNVEHALGEDNNVNKPMVLYMLPNAFGGHLEEVRDLVDQRITEAQAAGCNVGSARAQWTAGNTEFGLTHWDTAYVNYANAYKTAVQGPCN